MRAGGPLFRSVNAATRGSPAPSGRAGRVPRIAVVLPVYNGESYLGEAIESVLAQTFTDFELFVVDDGSTDRSAEVASRFDDPRLRLLRFPEHRGLVAALNHGIRESHSELVARMDADDICMPRRFERQVAYLESHPEVDICGTWTTSFGDESGSFHPHVDPRRIHAALFFGCAMDHPSILIRRAFLERHGLAYDDEYRHVEDYDFFLRAAEVGRLSNVPEVLLRTRAHAGEVSVIHVKEQVKTQSRLLLRQLRLLVPDATPEEERLHARIQFGGADTPEPGPATLWLVRLREANRERGLYDQDAFLTELSENFYILHAKVARDGSPFLRSYWNSPFPQPVPKRLREAARLVYECLYFRATRIARVLKGKARP